MPAQDEPKPGERAKAHHRIVESGAELGERADSHQAEKGEARGREAAPLPLADLEGRVGDAIERQEVEPLDRAEDETHEACRPDLRR